MIEVFARTARFLIAALLGMFLDSDFCRSCQGRPDCTWSTGTRRDA